MMPEPEQRPMGANVRGVDFITAVRDGATAIKEIICTDVKTSLHGHPPPGGGSRGQRAPAAALCGEAGPGA
jgi:hypothetical protein